MKSLRRLLKLFLHQLRAFGLLMIALVALPIFAGWIGDLIKEWIESPANISAGEMWLFAGGLIGLVIFLIVALREGKRLIRPRLIEQTTTVAPHKVVVAMLSLCTNLKKQNGETGSRWQVTDFRTSEKTGLDGLTLDDLVRVDPNIPQWPWQQTLRAAYPHRETLKRLVLLGSLDDQNRGSGTKDQLDLANEFFSTFFPGKVEIMGIQSRRWSSDFEDLEETQALLRRTIDHLHGNVTGYRDTDIVIDVTGGQKTASIAAAMVTHDRSDLTFQYVGTGERADTVFSFNVTSEDHRT